MITLHSYFGRELLKTFALTSIALTLLIVMGGGVANIVQGEGVGAEQMVKVFLFLTPVALTLILPIAALFSATITYGRAAADNEVIACRAAGINIHRLLVSAMLLGLGVTLFTYWSWNHLIPGLSHEIVEMSRKSLPELVTGAFQKARALPFGKYRITAGRCEALDPKKVPDRQLKDHTLLLLSNVAFLEMNDQELARFGTADATIIDFDNGGNTPKVIADLQGVRSYDSSRGQYYELAHQVIGPFEIPLPVKRKVKFEDLNTLLQYKRDPGKIPDIEGKLFNLKRALMAFITFRDVVDNLDPDRGGKGVYRLTRGDVTYEIAAGQFAIDPETASPTLRKVRVVEKLKNGGEGRVLTSETASLHLKSSLNPDRPVIMFDLTGGVEIHRENATADQRIVRKPNESLLPVEFVDQPELIKKYEALSTSTLLDPNRTMDELPSAQKKLRKKLLERVGELEAEVVSEIHFRASYALSTIAVVLMGAVLGIIVRGGQVLTAFGISCIPSMFVVVSSIVGRQLASRPAYINYSIMVMWGSTALMFLATAFVAGKILKR